LLGGENVEVRGRLSDAHNTIKEYENLGYRFIGSAQDIEYVNLFFKEVHIPKKNNVTDMKFNIGDFVENRDGRIGYISDICHCDECKKRGFFEPTIQYSDGTSGYISNYSAKHVSKDYKQIGIQKFDNDYYEKEIESLKHQLEIEKSKSAYWKMKARDISYSSIVAENI
jgi:hypothetical protein